MWASDRRRAASGRILVTFAVVLAGCAPGGPYIGPDFAFGPSYRAARSGAPVLLNNTEWWRQLQDPVLDQLVGLALRDNLTLEGARERVTEARASLQGIPGLATLAPSVGLRGAGTDDSGTGSTGPNGTGEARLGLSWMLDPYGARREQIKAAGARIEVADAEADAAQLLVLFNITDAYVELRFRQRVAHLLRQELQSRRQTLNITEDLLAADSATRLDVIRSQARVAEIQSQLPGAEAAITATQNEIAVLAGAAPGTLPVDLAAGTAQPRPHLTPDVGIPADLLRNRPDIRIAERSYYAAVADLGVAQASLYPTLSLTGAITLNALEGGRNSAAYFFGPTLQFPVFPGNAARAAVDARRARVLQAHTAWKTTVLNAILEVENALLDYQAVTASLQSASRAAELYREARDLTRELFGAGAATLGELIDAEQALAAADQALANAVFRRGQSYVALNVRLGSGAAVAGIPAQSGN